MQYNSKYMHALSIQILQILMNVQRTVMAVSRCAQTLMALLHVPVEMGFVLEVMGGAVMVSAQCSLKHTHNRLHNYPSRMFILLWKSQQVRQ